MLEFYVVPSFPPTIIYRSSLQFIPAEIPPVLQPMKTIKSAIMPLQYIHFSCHTLHYVGTDTVAELLKSAQHIYSIYMCTVYIYIYI